MRCTRPNEALNLHSRLVSILLLFKANPCGVGLYGSLTRDASCLRCRMIITENWHVCLADQLRHPSSLIRDFVASSVDYYTVAITQNVCSCFLWTAITDHIKRMIRLFWVFPGCACDLINFVVLRLIHVLKICLLIFETVVWNRQ